ncbi:hypothetical protein FAJ36_09015, partial [Streptococcus suis]
MRLGSSSAPLLRARVNLSAQWLIGFNSHYSECWSCAGVGVKRGWAKTSRSHIKKRAIPIRSCSFSISCFIIIITTKQLERHENV